MTSQLENKGIASRLVCEECVCVCMLYRASRVATRLMLVTPARQATGNVTVKCKSLHTTCPVMKAGVVVKKTVYNTVFILFTFNSLCVYNSSNEQLVDELLNMS